MTATYNPPIAQILLAMRTTRGSLGSGFSMADAEAVLTEAGRFAASRIAPLNRVGDLNPARLVDGEVITPPGWKQAYKEWVEAGWNGLSAPVEYGGQGLPFILAAACTELWNSASMAFALCPLLTTGAIEAIAAHASEDLKQYYLPKLISGEWSGTMNLTEPQSGSDLSQLRCKAKANGDGSYRITGNKIFITFGDHDCTTNIIHLVLARLEDAPQGTKGISLFLVPKILPDGSRNDLRCHSLEHKLGIHGSPTCAMIYGDNGGATGWLIGEENRGLACMFTMMNSERLLVAVQGVALAERATQAAFNFALERKQGRAPNSTETSSTIIHHPDVKRMLLDMRAKTSAARMLCMATAAATDDSVHAESENDRKRALTLASLLTPLAKFYATEIAVEVASTSIQLHGGMGFIEETGVAQFYRDARILPIYEGTSGIQAIDLVTRKLGLDDGKILAAVLQDCEEFLAKLIGEKLASSHVTEIRELAQVHIQNTGSEKSLAAATPFARALAVIVASAQLSKASVQALGQPLDQEVTIDANFYVATELPTTLAFATAAMAAAGTVVSADFT